MASPRFSDSRLRLGLAVAAVVSALAIGVTVWVEGWRSLAVYSLTQPAGERTAEYVLVGLTYTLMSAQGRPKYRIDARIMTRYINDRNTEFLDPVFHLYRPGESPLQARADWAQLSRKKDRLVLKGDVIVEQPQTQARRTYTVKTSEALVLPDQEVATTDRPLTLYGTNFYIESVGGRINLRTQKVHFFKEVKGIYEP